MTKRTKNNFFTLGGLALTTALSTFSMTAQADNPWGDLSGDGFTTKQIDTKNTVIDTHQMVAVGTGSNLDILSDESVRVNTLTNNGIFVASRVADNLLPTLIDGKLSSNGKVIIQDRNGIIYGSNSRTDVNGLVSTTAGSVNVSADGKSVDLDDFSNNGAVTVEQGAMISIKDGGLAAFVSPTVINNGIISAKAGKVELAGANTKTTIDLYGDGLLEIAVSDDNTSALLAENNGVIDAAGGVVHMTTGAAKNIVDSVVNMNGVITASSATQVGGKIILGGANTGVAKLSGAAAANGEAGGGTIQVVAEEATIEESAIVTANAIGNGNGGDIQILGNQFAAILGRTHAKGGALGGNGGFIELSSNEKFSLDGDIDTSAENGETGVFLLDPRDLEIRLGTGLDLDASTIYESTIEVLSNFTNIVLEARRNLMVSEDIYGLGSDGVINIANGNDLTITTINSPYTYISGYQFNWRTFTFDPIYTTEADNSGVIDLTGNSTYGADLEFKTTGDGSISILGATDVGQASNIVLSKLTTENGDITVYTQNGYISWMGDVTTVGGDINGTATTGITVSSALSTQTGDVNLLSSGNTWLKQVRVETTGAVESQEGNVTLSSQAGGNIISGEVSAAQGTVALNGQQVQLRNGSEVTGDSVSFAAGRVIQNATGKIVANALTGVTQSDAVLSGSENQVQSLGDFVTGDGNWHKGGLTLVNTGDLDIVGTVSSDNVGGNGTGNMDISTTGDLNIKSTGGVVTQDATIALASASLVDIDMGAVVSSGNADIAIGAPTVNLGADLQTTGTVSGTALSVAVENDSAQIQDGVDVAVSGATVVVGDGTFNERVTINKSITINGDGSTNITVVAGNGTGTGFTIAANDVSLNGMLIRNHNYGINVASDVTDLSMDDIASQDNSVGLKVSDAASIDGLTIENSRFNNNTYGWYFSKGDNNLANTSTVTDVNVTDTSFIGSGRKGMYVEKLDNATFTNVNVVASGIDAGYSSNAGVDINLKNGTYSNIVFDNINISGSGVNATGVGNAFTVKARNDGSYAATPATLTNFVLKNSTITAGGDVAVAIGNGVTDIRIRKNTITGPEAVLTYGGVENVTINGNAVINTGASNRGGAYGIGTIGNTGYTELANNTISLTDGSGIYAYDTTNFVARKNTITGGDNGILVDGLSSAILRNNTINATDNGVFVSESNGIIVTNNKILDSGNNGITVNLSSDTLVDDNIVRRSGGRGVSVYGSTGTEITDNRLTGNDTGVEIEGYAFSGEFDEGQYPKDFSEGQYDWYIPIFDSSSDDTTITNNIIRNNITAGVSTLGDGVGSVTLSANTIDKNTIGLLFAGGEIDISDFLNPNIISGGENAMEFDGEDVSLVNDTLGTTVFTDQSGNYITLKNGALFNPGTPTIIDGLAASWDGVVPLDSALGAGILTAVERQAIEDRIIDFDDDTSLGQILVGLGFDLNEEDIFALGLYSLSLDAANVNVTFRGLPPVVQPSAIDLANLSPAAGGEDFTAADLANLSPDAGDNQGCWASVADTGFSGPVNFSFGGIENAIADSSCVASN